MSDIAEQPCPACGRVPWDIIEWKARAVTAEAEIERLRELFRKYINHVAAEEGTTFMPSEHDGFSIEELEALETLEAEARAAWAKEAGQ